MNKQRTGDSAVEAPTGPVDAMTWPPGDAWLATACERMAELVRLMSGLGAPEERGAFQFRGGIGSSSAWPVPRAWRPTERRCSTRCAPWTGGHRLPNFTFTADDYLEAYDAPTVARLRRAIRAYDPNDVMGIGHALDV